MVAKESIKQAARRPNPPFPNAASLSCQVIKKKMRSKVNSVDFILALIIKGRSVNNKIHCPKYFGVVFNPEEYNQAHTCSTRTSRSYPNSDRAWAYSPLMPRLNTLFSNERPVNTIYCKVRRNSFDLCSSELL